jgi:formate-dependent nitrite reductase membrane component NrfD
LLAGAAALAMVAVGVRSNAATAQLLHDVLLWSLLANLFIMLVGELWMPHGTRDAARAARMLLRGPYCTPFWGMVVGIGHAAPVLLLVLVPGAPLVASFLASCGALVGLVVFEHLWLMAGQSAPLS